MPFWQWVLVAMSATGMIRLLLLLMMTVIMAEMLIMTQLIRTMIVVMLTATVSGGGGGGGAGGGGGGGGGGGEGSGWKSMLGTVASMWLLCAFLLSVRVPVIHIETKISDTLYCFCQRAWKSIILDPTHRTPKSSTHCMSLYRFVIYVQDTTKSSVSPAESWAFWEMMSLLRPPHSRVEID